MFALLKKKGWATSLSAGESGSSLSSRSVFMVHIELTDTGHSFPPCLTIYLEFRVNTTANKMLEQKHCFQELYYSIT